jgi:hypothetical protein
LINTQKEVVIKLAKLYSKINHQLKAIALSIDYLTRNQDSIDYDVANITCELLMSKNCFIECCYFVEALLEQEKEFGGVEDEELIELGLEKQNSNDFFNDSKVKNLEKLQQTIHSMIMEGFDPGSSIQAIEGNSD